MKTTNQPKTAYRTPRNLLWTTGALVALLAVGLAPSATADLAGADSCGALSDISTLTVITDPVVNFGMSDPGCVAVGMDQGITVSADVSFASVGITGGCRVTWTATVSATNPGFVFDYTYFVGKVGGLPQREGSSFALNGPVTLQATENIARGASITLLADIENDDLGIDDATASRTFKC